MIAAYALGDFAFTPLPEVIAKLNPNRLELEKFEKFKPTAADPGSRTKRDILAKRVAQGLPLYHPDDRKPDLS
jgi:hypothetical protein